MSEAAVEAMATLAAIASLGLGPGDRSLAGFPRLAAGALFWRLSEEVSRARRQGSSVALLVIEIEELARPGVAPDVLARLAHAIEQTLRDELRDFDRVGRLGSDLFGVVLPGASGDVASAVARRVIHRLKAVRLESAGQSDPLGVMVAVAEWQEAESADAFLARAMSLVARSDPDVRGALDAQAGPTPNLPGGC